MSCKHCGFVTASATTYPYSNDIWQCPSCGYLQGKTIERFSKIVSDALIRKLDNSNNR